MESIRTFVCLELSDSFKQVLIELQEDLSRLGGGVRWTRAEGLHLTLNFLGDVSEEKIADVIQAVKNASKNVSPISVHLSNVGAFPNLYKPRVYWVGVRDDKNALTTLKKRIDGELGNQFPKDNRKYLPHLTIGRVKFDNGLENISNALGEIKLPLLNYLADEVVIKKSELLPRGAVHTPLAVVKLTI